MMVAATRHTASVEGSANERDCEAGEDCRRFVEIETMSLASLEQDRRRNVQKDADDHAGELGVVMRERFRDGRGERAERRHQREDEQQPESFAALSEALKQQREKDDGDGNVVDDDAPEQRCLRMAMPVIVARVPSVVVPGVPPQRHSLDESVHAQTNHHSPRHRLVNASSMSVIRVMASVVRMIVIVSVAGQMSVSVLDALREVIEQDLKEKSSENKEADGGFRFAERLRQKMQHGDGEEIGSAECGEQLDAASFARLKEPHSHGTHRHREK